MAESVILHDVILAVSALPRTLVWRNNTGSLMDRTGRWVSFGLPGSGDVIGVCDGVPVAIETKVPKRGPSEQQLRFAAAWRRAGGLYVLAHSAEEALDGIAAGRD